MGLEFYDTFYSKECKNHCIFCFIDQLPKGLRDTLYVKDDDERLSFLQGNYITLTNLDDKEIERICEWKIPVNISVHTTDENLRVKMLANKEAGKINDRLKRLFESHVLMNVQIVLVPDINDKTLVSTIKDLYKYFPYIQSVSVVPVGLTKYRKGLFPLRTFTREEARKIIDVIQKLQKKYLEETNTPFVFLSDEFYLLADSPLPEIKHYGSFDQLENGVGMITSFTSDFTEALRNTHDEELKNTTRNVLLITGELFSKYLEDLLELFREKYSNFNLKVLPVKNNFFGDTVGVAGLLTGKDILKAIKKIDYQNYDEIFIPDTTLKNETTLFLDDESVENLSINLGKKIRIIQNDGKALLEALLDR